MALRRQLNSIKDEPFPWMRGVTKNAPQMAIIQLGAAFKNFFAGRAKSPKFRKKGLHDRFSLTNDQFGVDGSRIRIPNLGWVRMRETLRFNGKIMSATVAPYLGFGWRSQGRARLGILGRLRHRCTLYRQSQRPV
ncbi:MAG TPA: hypothetical protein VMV40_03640 [Acidiferrobacter sp.]|nr:hypothetical protein [Acidiferrobacter sp.]